MRTIILLFLIICKLQSGFAQDDPAIWTFNVKTINARQAELIIKVSLPPGWHIYSQFLEKGGPIPTRIHIDPNPDFIPAGQITETGDVTTFYDELYEMDITWFKDSALFSQPLTMHRTVTVVKGKVEYMICNDVMCVPANKPFSISVTPTHYKN